MIISKLAHFLAPASPGGPGGPCGPGTPTFIVAAPEPIELETFEDSMDCIIWK